MTALSLQQLPGDQPSVDLAAPPPLRLVSAPTTAPPYDDDLTGAPVLRLVAAPVGHPDVDQLAADDAWLAAARTASADLPAVRVFAHVLVQGLLEVLAGVRPVTQLRTDTTPELYQSLRRSVLLRARTPGPRPDRRAVRSLHVQQRPEGVAEICATVQRGPRVVAIALRVEGLDGRWRCTELAGV